MNIKFATILGLAILAASSAKAQTVLYNQYLSLATAYVSDNASSSTLYDDFTLSAGGVIKNVSWYGTDPGEYSTGFTGFTVEFLSDNGGLPGSVLADNFIGAPAGEYATHYMGDPGYQLFGFSGTLSTPFTAAPGTEYFLSIAADISGGDWYWTTADQGDNGAVGCGGDYGNSFYPIDTDVAFTLSGTTVPEPSTIALALFGASAFLFGRRK
jgi:hypothetical protein